MRKKLIITAIIGLILIGGTTTGIVLNNNYFKEKQESVAENEEHISSEKDQNNKDEKAENNQEDLEGSKENNEKDSSNKEEGNKKQEEQEVNDKYTIFYKARDAYNREDFDEAIRLYETITDKDVLAKVEYEKDRFYFAKKINDEINEGQKLYDSGKYFEAKVFMSKLIRGNYMLPNQEARANKIYEEASSKVTKEEVEKVNGKFTFEKAVELVKKEIGDNPNNTYENFQEYTDINGAKVYQVIVKKNGDSNNSELFVVSSDGSVLSGS
ncbi:hypothetical protein [Clostridium perfringens]|uniref:hypothetical protein n=1 Tax=Clostridium perfringens TaxID=1502 RepID=UPI00233FC016|nr:hypothetical protein [Clostridium perfringens]MDC4245480.1 hypothetical protein [Clostridium perfringens]MDU2435947.1 hypothetical protein [Clostridium perfringens]MDU2516430.1 hypothetical protein [Clostridium perfringens]